MIERLQYELDAAGIPNEGVATDPPRVFFLPAATGQHRQQAAAILAQFMRRRKPRPIGQLIQDVEALTANQRNKLLAAMAAAFLRDNPTAARRLGIPLDGDESE